jgi:lysophospholipase L1-like esterase
MFAVNVAALTSALAFDAWSSRAAETTAEAPPAKAAAKAPEPDWASIFQIHYTDRVRAFQVQNEQLEYVVFVGDSITEGFNLAKHFPGRRVLNRGIGADVIGNEMPEGDRRGVLRRMDESFFRCAASDAFLLIGINDLGMGRKPAQLEAGYREMLRQVRERTPLVRLRVQSVLPTRGKYAKHNADVLDFNARLRKLAEEFDCQYVDLHKLMIDEHGELRSELTADGLHINEKGYEIWRAEVERLLGW